MPVLNETKDSRQLPETQFWSFSLTFDIAIRRSVRLRLLVATALHYEQRTCFDSETERACPIWQANHSTGPVSYSPKLFVAELIHGASLFFENRQLADHERYSRSTCVASTSTNLRRLLAGPSPSLLFNLQYLLLQSSSRSLTSVFEISCFSLNILCFSFHTSHFGSQTYTTSIDHVEFVAKPTTIYQSDGHSTHGCGLEVSQVAWCSSNAGWNNGPDAVLGFDHDIWDNPRYNQNSSGW